MDKHLIVVYGKPNEEFVVKKQEGCSGSCESCLDDCATENPTQRKLFDMLCEFVMDKKVDDKVICEFIDVDKDDMGDHVGVVQVMAQGYALPLVEIDSKLRMYGGIDPLRIWEIISQE